MLGENGMTCIPPASLLSGQGTALFAAFHSHSTLCQQLHDCWLSEQMDAFLSYRLAQQFQLTTLVQDAYRLLGFARFVERQGEPALDQLPRWVELFLPQLPHQ